MSNKSEESIHLENYRNLIRRMVGELQFVYATAPRPFPQLPSVYYDGTNDKLAFDNWLRTFLLYFRASMMCGEEYDDFRVTTAAESLKGVARDWFFARVAKPGSSIPYKFEEVVIEMARVFIAFGSPPRSTSLPKYIPGTTARAFYFQLQYYYETDNPTATEEQGGPYIRRLFLMVVRKAMMEMNPEDQDEVIIGDWFVDCINTSSQEALLDQTQHTLDKLERRKQGAQDAQDYDGDES